MFDEKTWIFIGNLWFTGLGILMVLISGLIYFIKKTEKRASFVP